MTMTTLPPAPMCTGMPLPPGVTLEHVLVTPEVAAEFLRHNTHNRSQKPVFQDRYADDMAQGDWSWTGEPIRFDVSGRLLDGQNRLHALIAADVSLPFIVIRGLPPESQDDMDTGASRKFSDVLKLAGEANANQLAAIVRRVAAWELGYRRNLNGVVTSYHALRRTLDEHPEIRDLVTPSRKVADACGLSGAIAGLAWWVLSNIDADDAEFFFARLGDGQSLIKGDPIFELRRTLHDTKNVRGQRNETFLLAITMKAWNAYRNGETVGLYRWRPGGAKPEKFPEPI